MNKRFLSLILILIAALFSPPARAQGFAALAAQGPGANLISDASGTQMISAFGSSVMRPGNMRGAYVWDAVQFRQLLSLAGAAQVRFHLAVNGNGDFTIHPEILDSNGASLGWAPVDTATGLAISASAAQGNSQAWAGTKLKPSNAPNTITYPASAFAWLLSLPGAAQLRMSPALNSSGAITLVGNALDASGNVITQTDSTYSTIDAGTPCPPICRFLIPFTSSDLTAIA